MRKSIVLTLLTTATILLLLGRFEVASAVSQSAHKPMWAGCYLAEYDNGIQQLVTVSSDGTFVAHDTTDLGFPSADLDGAVHGMWEMTGPFHAALQGLWFQYDEVGVHTFTVRVRMTSQTDNDWETFTNAGWVDLFLPTQDPLTEEPFMSDVAYLSGTSRKLTIR